MPSDKRTNHFHFSRDPVRVKVEAIKARQTKRRETEPSAITNEVLFEMMSDILESQLILDKKLQDLLGNKQRPHWEARGL
jgi:hypothetical protein